MGRVCRGPYRGRGSDVGNPLEKSISISLRNDLCSRLWNLEQREGELKGIQLSLGDWFFFPKGILKLNSSVENAQINTWAAAMKSPVKISKPGTPETFSRRILLSLHDEKEALAIRFKNLALKVSVLV